MIYKLAFAGDLHKRAKDISTIQGYVKCTELVQESLIKFFIEDGITHFISGGDWYDKGYADDVSTALADITVEEYINKLLHGNFYGVIGNHIRLNLDSNPELTLIQPHPTLKSRKEVKRTEPIIKTPNHFVLGDVQISLVHNIPNRDSVEDYSILRLPNIKYHVAYVHDSIFIPNEKLALTQHPGTRTVNTQISRVLSEVDLCICADMHMPLGMFDVSDKTKMYISGSLTNTNAGLHSRHGFINIPIITIDDVAMTHSLSYKHFDLHINTLTFDSNAEQKVIDKLKTLRGNSIAKLYPDDVQLESIMATGIASMAFGAFLREQGYTTADKELIKSTIRNPADITNLMKIHYNDIKV